MLHVKVEKPSEGFFRVLIMNGRKIENIFEQYNLAVLADEIEKIYGRLPILNQQDQPVNSDLLSYDELLEIVATVQR